MRPHPFLALTDSDREGMLGAIGVETVDELFRDLPEAVRLGRERAFAPDCVLCSSEGPGRSFNSQ